MCARAVGCRPAGESAGAGAWRLRHASRTTSSGTSPSPTSSHGSRRALAASGATPRGSASTRRRFSSGELGISADELECLRRATSPSESATPAMTERSGIHDAGRDRHTCRHSEPAVLPGLGGRCGDRGDRRRGRDRRAARLSPRHLQRARRHRGRQAAPARGVPTGTRSPPSATSPRARSGSGSPPTCWCCRSTIPLAIAKRYGTLDRISGGRLILGVGVGSAREEFELIGVPFAGRGDRMDDALRAIRQTFGRPRPSYHGTHYSFDGWVIQPHGIQQTVPLWIGGRSERALERAVELGDGWAPQGANHHTFAEMVKRAKDRPRSPRARGRSRSSWRRRQSSTRSRSLRGWPTRSPSSRRSARRCSTCGSCIARSRTAWSSSRPTPRSPTRTGLVQFGTPSA